MGSFLSHFLVILNRFLKNAPSESAFESFRLQTSTYRWQMTGTAGLEISMTKIQSNEMQWKMVIQRFNEIGKLVTLRKKEIFAKQGLSMDHIGYVKKGAFKLVYHHQKKEWIKSFLFEGSFLGSIPSILQKKPSTYSIIALEPSEVLVLPSKKFSQLFEIESMYQKFLIQFLTSLYLKKEKRVSEFLLLDAKQRYQNFIDEFFENESRISQIDQAAYLGITNVALSRLKKDSFANNPLPPSNTFH
ncbi:Crp/Fnr family transcriptional regulator [Leptospira biflexa]|uniref:Crp/Fnr family transcriptional regulator n=1 Tax=Leptospira biflexa TaxID=172 RepID=UPI001F472741|nr:Crp/Fnr family transcriptional regulator [Leptospira biflexa]